MMLMTGVNDSAMVVFIFLVDDMPMLVTGGVMAIFIFVVGDMVMLVMGEVSSPCCYIGEARKSCEEPNNGLHFPTWCRNRWPRRKKQHAISGP
jgi:hypothetical protein